MKVWTRLLPRSRPSAGVWTCRPWRLSSVGALAPARRTSAARQRQSNLLPPVPAVSELPCRHPGYLAPSPYLPLTEDKGRGHQLALREDKGRPAHPHTVLSELGAMVWHHIWQIGSYRGEEDVQVQMAVCMPTHIHMILKVGRHLPFKRNGQPMSLGDVVRGFKQGCTSAFKRRLRGEPMELPSGYQRQWLTPPGAVSEISLWDDNYNDCVILDNAGLQSSVAYIGRRTRCISGEGMGLSVRCWIRGSWRGDG